jgi:hypothetical protein
MNKKLIDEMAKQIYSNSAELDELRKTFEDTSMYPVSTQIEYTDVLKRKAFERAPFFRFLEAKGQVFDNNAAYAGYFKVNEAGNSATYISELEDLPAAVPENIEEVYDKMKVLTDAIEVSDLAQMGNTRWDILAQQIDNKFLNVLNKTDETMTKGEGTNNSKDFKGVEKIITSHVDDLSTGDDGKLSENVIDDMLKDIYDDNGHVDCLLASPNVAKYLKALMAPYRRINDVVDMSLGHRVFTYESLLGYPIPIIVTPNFTDPYKSSGATDTLACIDSSSFELRRLMPPTLIQNLPINKLAIRHIVATFQTMICTGQFCNGLIKGITGVEQKFYDGDE